MREKPNAFRVAARSMVPAAGMGAIIAALDCGRSLAGVGANELAPVSERDFLGTALWYVGAWAVAGCLMGLTLGLATADAYRKSVCCMLAGSLFFLLVGVANVFLLPAYTHPLALATDFGVAALCTALLILLLRFRARAPGRSRTPRPRNGLRGPGPRRPAPSCAAPPRWGAGRWPTAHRPGGQPRGLWRWGELHGGHLQRNHRQLRQRRR